MKLVMDKTTNWVSKNKSTLIKNDIMNNQIRELKYLTSQLENAKEYISDNKSFNQKFNVRVQGIILDLDLVKIELLKSIKKA
jgi:hypothetical protein